MGFRQVYSSLVNIFPQIDTRVLGAVAIEHSNDVDAACKAVIADIIPLITLRSTSGSPVSRSLYEGQSEGVLAPNQTMDNPVISGEGQNYHDDDDVCNAHLEGAFSGQNLENSVQAKIDTQHHGEKVSSGDLETKSGTDFLLSPVENDEKSVDTEDEDESIDLNSSRFRIPNMEALEEIIADAGNNKKTLCSAMEPVISLMKEVELREQAAEQAKLEGDKVCAVIRAEMKKREISLRDAIWSNSTDAGGVYYDREKLATELRELESRVLSLADERDKSLTVLDETRQTLEVRLAAAENAIKFAEQKKLEKEEAAMKDLADYELSMEKVAQESKMFEQLYDENAKLQEFLDRGCVVDLLEEELAVLCKDVRLLKESIDDNVPYSKALSSCQTSSCILASSSSSKNLNPEELATPGGADPSVTTESERDAVSCIA